MLSQLRTLKPKPTHRYKLIFPPTKTGAKLKRQAPPQESQRYINTSFSSSSSSNYSFLLTLNEITFPASSTLQIQNLPIRFLHFFHHKNPSCFFHCLIYLPKIYKQNRIYIWIYHMHSATIIVQRNIVPIKNHNKTLTLPQLNQSHYPGNDSRWMRNKNICIVYLKKPRWSN